jgi:hypothetical protein
MAGCGTRTTVESFDLRHHLENEEGVAMYAAETRRTLEEETAERKPESMGKLAVYDYLGYGANEDHAKALALFREAASLGDKRALFCLGVLCAQGKEQNKDELEAYRCFALLGKGVDKNAELARSFAGQIYSRLNAEQKKSLETPADPLVEPAPEANNEKQPIAPVSEGHNEKQSVVPTSEGASGKQSNLPAPAAVSGKQSGSPAAATTTAKGKKSSSLAPAAVSGKDPLVPTHLEKTEK